MRILFNGFQSDHTYPVLSSLITHLNLSYCATIDISRRLQTSSIEVDHHNFWEVIWGNYPIPESQLLPLDEKLVREMAHCEVAVLRMMDRLDPLHPKSYCFRKKMYLRHLQYWNHFLITKQITHLISINIPHEIHDYVAYCLCKRSQIPTLMFWQAALPDMTFLFDDIEMGPIELEKALLNAKKDFPSHMLCPLSESLEDYWKLNTKTSELPPAPFYMQGVQQELKQAHSISYIFKRSIGFIQSFMLKKNPYRISSYIDLMKECWWRYRKRRQLLQLDRQLWDNYNQSSITPNLNTPYIYVPLHYQPECTTCPMGGVFVDQDLMIKILATAASTFNIPLYVKEHPVQRSQGRSPDFYDTLREIPSVTFVKTNVSSALLIRNATAVATITGTAGWEALFEKKPVLMFGSFFFQYAPGVFNIRSLNACRDALGKIVTEKFKGNHSELRLFLFAISKIAVPGYTDANYKVISKITNEENADNISKALLIRLRQLKF